MSQIAGKEQPKGIPMVASIAMIAEIRRGTETRVAVVEVEATELASSSSFAFG